MILTFGLKQGKKKLLPKKEKKLPAKILTKMRKLILQQNATRKCVNMWDNA